MESGVLAGYPLVDLKVTLVDGSYHEVDSSEMAFKVAGSMALKEGAAKAGPVLLEPVMKVEVVVPDEFTGDVIGNLSARRGVDRWDGAARRRHCRRLTRTCRWRRCSGMRPTCAR